MLDVIYICKIGISEAGWFPKLIRKSPVAKLSVVHEEMGSDFYKKIQYCFNKYQSYALLQTKEL